MERTERIEAEAIGEIAHRLLASAVGRVEGRSKCDEGEGAAHLATAPFSDAIQRQEWQRKHDDKQRERPEGPNANGVIVVNASRDKRDRSGDAEVTSNAKCDDHLKPLRYEKGEGVTHGSVASVRFAKFSDPRDGKDGEDYWPENCRHRPVNILEPTDEVGRSDDSGEVADNPKSKFHLTSPASGKDRRDKTKDDCADEEAGIAHAASPMGQLSLSWFMLRPFAENRRSKARRPSALLIRAASVDASRG